MILLLGLVIGGCEKDVPPPEDSPEELELPRTPGMVGVDEVDLEGNFIDLDGTDGFGYEGNGTISFELDCNTVSFEVEDANIQFNSDSLFMGLSGNIALPEAEDGCFIGTPTTVLLPILWTTSSGCYW